MDYICLALDSDRLLELLNSTMLHCLVYNAGNCMTNWYIIYVRFEVLTEVNMENGVFWYVSPCGSCKNRLFGGT
jgi:hypothetical protein